MKPKYLVILLFVTVLPYRLLGQGKIDSLLSKLSNDELYGECNYVWVLKHKEGPAQELINIGKPATRVLLNCLNTEDKGIVSHYILSKIWLQQFPIRSSFETFDRNETVEYEVNGLKFFENEKKGKFVNPGDLEKTEQYWRAYIKKASANTGFKL